MRSLILSNRPFVPDEDVLDDITKTLAPEAYERAVEMDKATQTAPPAEKFMTILRMTGRDIAWWAVNIVSQMALDNLMGNPPSTLKQLAHRSGVTEAELGTMMNTASADSVALLSISLPPPLLKDLQVAITPTITETGKQMLLEFRQIERMLTGGS